MSGGLGGLFGSSASASRVATVAMGPSRTPVRSMPVAAYLAPQTPPMPTGDGYGIVIMTSGAASNAAICETYLSTLHFQKSFTQDNVRQAQRAIYWPIARETPEPDVAAPAGRNCAMMLAAYDYPRATENLLKLGAMSGSLRRLATRSGPFLIGYRHGEQVGTVYDFTDVPPAKLSDTFRGFLLLMTQEPTLWDGAHAEPAKIADILSMFINDPTVLAVVGLVVPAQAYASVPPPR